MARILLLTTLLFPAMAGAEQYQGYLIPGNYASPMAIELKLKFDVDLVAGTVRASMPSPMDGRVTGSRMGALCNLTLTFASSNTKANLRGHCDKENFDGDYKLYSGDNKKQTGLFNLKHQKKAKLGKATEEDAGPQLSTAACIKRNATCLGACPRGDYNTEFLCANACRHKKLACQGKIKASRNAAAEGGAAEEEDNP